jgi:hypothetical protein
MLLPTTHAAADYAHQYCFSVIVTVLLVWLCLQDMNQLQSLFSAKPWQQGPFATVKFLFRARAARAARMRRSGHNQSPVQQQQPQTLQAAKKVQQQLPVVAAEAAEAVQAEDSSLSHVYVVCAQPEQQQGASTAVSNNNEA